MRCGMAEMFKNNTRRNDSGKMTRAVMQFCLSSLFLFLYIEPYQGLLIIVYLMSIPVVSFNLEISFSNFASKVFFNPHVQYFRSLNSLLMEKEFPRDFLSPIPRIRYNFNYIIHHANSLEAGPLFYRVTPSSRVSTAYSGRLTATINSLLVILLSRGMYSSTS